MSEEQATVAAPLDGVRVLDVSGPIGAYCTRLLADLGADVVLVEPPEGDRLRRLPPFDDDDPDRPLLFAWYHASQRSVVVAPDDDDRLASLGAGADVVLIAPTARHPVPGWDPTTQMLAWAPDAIVCCITPFGISGPQSAWRSTSMVSFAMGGNMIRAGTVEGPPLTIPGRQLWDEVGAHAAVAILAALRARDAVGPQTIDLSVLELTTSRDQYIEWYDVTGLNPHGRLVKIGLPPSGTYQCADGPFSVACYQVRHWEAFLTMLDHPPELADEALTNPVVRQQRHEELGATIRDLMKDRSRADLLERGQAARLPCVTVNRPTQFVADEQFAARGSIAPTPTPWGPVAMPVPGSGFQATPSLTVVSRSTAPATPGGDDVAWPARAAARPHPEKAPGEGPLHGVRILSFGAFVAGNSVGTILGQLGADVIKIERHDRPEVLRTAAYGYGGFVVTEPSGVPNTVMYAGLTRSVREVSIDVTTPEGADIFRSLVAVADVVIENFGTGVVESWGLGFDALRAANPSIVMTSLSGFGRTGPRASYLAYASNISNFSGLAYEWNFIHGSHSDYITGVHAALGTLAALEHVRQTGEAVLVDSAQIEAMAATMPEFVLQALANGRDVPPPANQVAGSLLSGAFRCVGHDAWIAVELEDLHDWARLCQVVNIPIPVESTAEAADLRPALEAALHGWTAERTAPTAAKLLQRAGLAAGVVQSPEDLWHNPQLWARQFIEPIPHQDLGTHYYNASPYRLSQTPRRVSTVAGRLGANTAELLQEWLGLSTDDVDKLIQAGAAFQA